MVLYLIGFLVIVRIWESSSQIEKIVGIIGIFLESSTINVSQWLITELSEELIDLAVFECGPRLRELHWYIFGW